MAIKPRTEIRLMQLVPLGKTAPEIHNILIEEGHSVSLRTVNYRLSEYNRLAHQTLAELEREAVEAMADRKLDLRAKIALLDQLVSQADKSDCIPRNPGQTVGYFNSLLKYRNAYMADRKAYSEEQVVEMFSQFQHNLLDKIMEAIQHELQKQKIPQEAIASIARGIIAPINNWFHNHPVRSADDAG